MKNLTKMLAMVAAVSAMHAAKAESQEKDFVLGGEIQKISIVNGQLEVRSKGSQVQDVKTPYAYVGTNTEHFAESAFAKGGLDKIDSYVHVGNGEIYITEKGDVYKTQIRKAPAALNGVTSIKVVSKASDNPNLAAQNAEVRRINADYPGSVVKVFGNEIYKAASNANGDWTIEKYAGKDSTGTNDVWTTSSDPGVGTKEITDFVIVMNGNEANAFALAEDGNVYSNARRFGINAAESIALAGDQTTVILTADDKEVYYDGKNGKKKEEEKTTSLTAEQVAQLQEKAQAQASDKIVSSVVAGDVLYYATAKKLGWYRERN